MLICTDKNVKQTIKVNKLCLNFLSNTLNPVNRSRNENWLLKRLNSFILVIFAKSQNVMKLNWSCRLYIAKNYLVFYAIVLDPQKRADL